MKNMYGVQLPIVIFPISSRRIKRDRITSHTINVHFSNQFSIKYFSEY